MLDSGFSVEVLDEDVGFAGELSRNLLPGDSDLVLEDAVVVGGSLGLLSILLLIEAHESEASALLALRFAHDLNGEEVSKLAEIVVEVILSDLLLKVSNIAKNT